MILSYRFILETNIEDNQNQSEPDFTAGITLLGLGAGTYYGIKKLRDLKQKREAEKLGIKTSQTRTQPAPDIDVVDRSISFEPDYYYFTKKSIASGKSK